MKKANRIKPISVKKKEDGIRLMISQIDDIIKEANKYEKIYQKSLKKVHPDNLISAKNLIHYRSLRLHDLSNLQKKLGDLGLSRLANTQGNVLAGLKSTRSILLAFLGKEPHPLRLDLSVKKAKRLARKNAKNLLGYRSKRRQTRIMVTLPSEAAENYRLVENMIRNGMNCARINCAHDREEDWLKMIGNIQKASQKLKKRCKISMDLAGPKIRTGSLSPGPKIKKLRPPKNNRGRIVHPLIFWMGVEMNMTENLSFIPISKRHLVQLDLTRKLYFVDSRGKKESLKWSRKKENGYLVSISKTAYVETGMNLHFQKNMKGVYVTVGELPSVAESIRLKEGDFLKIDRKPIIGENSKKNKKGNLVSLAHISCTVPEVFDQVKVKEPILFNDGKIGGIIEAIQDEYIIAKITRTNLGGSNLGADKGINLPMSKLTLNGLTRKDQEDLKFIIQHADVVNLSFVNSKKDVVKLINLLKKLKANSELGVIFKIETQNGFNRFTEIMLEAMQLKSIGVMIARGDLTIEVGWGNIGRVQQEILALCEAAHITDIWATQVLENLARQGIPSRAEITDVINAQRADCVMLNKGPFILKSIKFLNQILGDMEPYREKNTQLTPAMKLAVAAD